MLPFKKKLKNRQNYEEIKETSVTAKQKNQRVYERKGPKCPYCQVSISIIHFTDLFPG